MTVLHVLSLSLMTLAASDTRLSKIHVSNGVPEDFRELGVRATFLARIPNMLCRKYGPIVVHMYPLHSKSSAH